MPWRQITAFPYPENVVLGSLQAAGQLRGGVSAPQATVQFELAESTYPGSGELTFRNNTLVVDNTSVSSGGGHH